MRMKKETIVKEDGRLLTYYWFGNSHQPSAISRQPSAKESAIRNPKSAKP